MNKKLKTNWWIDITLFTSFLITFYLDLTGLTLHQWIGMVCIALAAIHLFLHRDWVRSVVKRFFQKKAGKTHFYLGLDSLIMVGFGLIGLTGMVMSTWLNLPLQNYDAWRQTHIVVSLTTLVLVLAKLAFHLRWFKSMFRKLLSSSKVVPVQNLAMQTTANEDAKLLGRREFMLTLGVMGTASFIALASASKSLAETITTVKTVEAQLDPIQTTESTATTLPVTETTGATTQPTQTVEAVTQTPTVAATPTAASPAVATESNCTVRCQRGCSYPGHCRRYTDANNNNLCDLGECL